MTTPQAIVIAAVILAVTQLVIGRYDLQRTHDSGGAHVIDRWTGSLAYIVHDERMPVTQYKPAK